MSETTEDDDNMIVFVVEDENSKDDRLIQVPCPITIKIEPLDDSVKEKSDNEIFQSPAQTEDEDNTKEELEAEYLEDLNKIKDDLEEDTEEYEVEYLDETIEEDDIYDFIDNDDKDYSDHENETTSKRSRKKNTAKSKACNDMTPQKKVPEKYSVIKHLREKYPELATDEKLLIEHLVSVMREIKPPEPPKNFCKEIKDEKSIKYECQLCGVQRDTRTLAARHFQFKHGENYLTCFACGVKYRNTTNLYKHEKRCSAPDARTALRARGLYLGRKGRGRPYTTDNRFITSNSPTVLKEKTRLFCSACPASFVHRASLVAHENSHAGRRPYRCHHCAMAYTAHPALKRHLKLHSDYQYVCDHCGRKFKLKPALVSHLDSHRPVRKHGCLYCERRFCQKTALRHHINKQHLNLPPAHGCPVCPKRYARLTHVKEHMGRVHGLTMITRRMYYQALPSMTDSEVTHARRFFNFDVNQQSEPKNVNKETKHIQPDSIDVNTTYTTEQKLKPKAQLQKIVQIIQKKKPETSQIPVSEYTDHDNDPLAYSIAETETNYEIKEEVVEPEEQRLDNAKSKTKRILSQRKIGLNPEQQVDEEIEENLYYIQYKRQNKKVIYPSKNKKADDEMHKMVRNIKSTLNNQKVVTCAKKKTLYELKRHYINDLKYQVTIPEQDEDDEETIEEKPESLVPGTEIPENLVLGTEIPEHVVPGTEIPENVESENEKDTDHTSSDEE